MTWCGDVIAMDGDLLDAMMGSEICCCTWPTQLRLPETSVDHVTEFAQPAIHGDDGAGGRRPHHELTENQSISDDDPVVNIVEGHENRVPICGLADEHPR